MTLTQTPGQMLYVPAGWGAAYQALDDERTVFVEDAFVLSGNGESFASIAAGDSIAEDRRDAIEADAEKLFPLAYR